MESGISFFIGQLGMILFLAFTYSTLSMTDFIMWASLEFGVGGYITYQIQKQKKYDYENDIELGRFDNRKNWREFNNTYDNQRHINNSGSGYQEDPESEPLNSTKYPT